MKSSSKVQAFGQLALGITAGGILAGCGPVTYQPGDAANAELEASLQTHQEFEEYWAQRRAGVPHEEIIPEEPEPVEAPEPAPIDPPEMVDYTPEDPVPVHDEPEEEYVDSAPWPDEPRNNPFADTKASRKDAKVAMTWFEYQGDTGRGSRSYSQLGGEFPQAIPVRFSRRYVRSPYDGQYVDVKLVPRGVLVADPSYPVSARQYFFLP